MEDSARRQLKRTHFRAGLFASCPPSGVLGAGACCFPSSVSPLAPPPLDVNLDAEYHLHALRLARYSDISPYVPPLSAAMPGRHYSKFIPPSLAMSELVCQKLDNDATDMLIDKWLERPHRPDSYYEWFQRVRERKHIANANSRRDQILLWNKGVFVPENIFTRTVDTGRLIPLDRTWVTHVYHHRSMKRLTMMPVIFSMVSPAPAPGWLLAPNALGLPPTATGTYAPPWNARQGLR